MLADERIEVGIAKFLEQALPEPGRAHRPSAVRSPKRAQTARGRGAVGSIGAVGVVDTVEERGFGAFDEGVVMEASAGGTAGGDNVVDEGGVHAGPVVSLLTAHGEALDDVQGVDPEVFRQELVLCAHAVAVVELFGEVGRIRWGGGFAIAEHGDDDDMVGRESGVGAGVGGGGVDAAAVAGGDAGFFGG